MTREEKNTKEKIPREGLKRRSHKEILEEVQKRRSKRGPARRLERTLEKVLGNRVLEIEEKGSNVGC
jgi:hypothetical protein